MPEPTGLVLPRIKKNGLVPRPASRVGKVNKKYLIFFNSFLVFFTMSRNNLIFWINEKRLKFPIIQAKKRF